VAMGPMEATIEPWLAPMRRMPSEVSTIGITVDTAAIRIDNPYTGAACATITCQSRITRKCATTAMHETTPA